MPIKYFEAPDIKKRVDDIVNILCLFHVDSQSVYCFRSAGSKSRRTIARIHGLRRIWQNALHIPPTYIIEVISERYDKLTEEEKDKTLIHELLHIPKGFSGGFRPHKGYIHPKMVEHLYKKLEKKKTSQKEAHPQHR